MASENDVVINIDLNKKCAEELGMISQGVVTCDALIVEER